MQRFGNFSVAILTSVVLAPMLLLATGLFGDVPCGEDGWRWGLAQGAVEIPVYVLGVLFAIAGAFFKSMSWRQRFSLMAVQIVISFLLVIIILWPDLFYVPPECL